MSITPTFLLVGTAFFLGYVIGWFIRGWLIVLRMAQNPEAAIKVLQDVKILQDNLQKDTAALGQTDPVPEGVEIVFEKMGVKWYAYRKETGQFLTQADGLALVIEQLDRYYPEDKFWYTQTEDTQKA